MFTRSNILRSLLALILALWNPVCLCASASASTGPASMSGCDSGCDCCKQQAPGGCDDSAPGEKHRDCSSGRADAISATAEIAPAKFSQLFVLHMFWEVRLFDDFGREPMRLVDSRGSIERPASSLLRQHCALII
ncbi:MAG: hypothetical protein JNK16_10680 [Phycisphaerales bacterium]|nr:hypothetical protein [Phycisphaerales bacterium]